MVRSLKSDLDNRPLVSAAQVSVSSPPAHGDAPDILVATPVGLLMLMKEAGRHYGWLYTEEGLQASIKHVVLDESDVLFGMAYWNAVDQILQVCAPGWAAVGRGRVATRHLQGCSRFQGPRVLGFQACHQLVKLGWL